MENEPLNLADFYERRAQRFLKSNRFDQAIESLEKSLFYIDEVKKNIRFEKGIQLILVLEEEYKRQISRIQWRKKYELIKISPAQNSDSSLKNRKSDTDRPQPQLNNYNTKYHNDEDNLVKSYELNDIISIEPLDLPPLEMPTFNFLELDAADDAENYFSKND